MATSTPPFKRSQIVQVAGTFNGVMPFEPGTRLRVISCRQGTCESGWLVDATKTMRGPLGAHPFIDLQGYDANWFEAAG